MEWHSFALKDIQTKMISFLFERDIIQAVIPLVSITMHLLVITVNNVVMTLKFKDYL